MVNGLVYVVGHWAPRAWMKGGGGNMNRVMWVGGERVRTGCGARLVVGVVERNTR